MSNGIPTPQGGQGPTDLEIVQQVRRWLDSKEAEIENRYLKRVCWLAEQQIKGRTVKAVSAPSEIAPNNAAPGKKPSGSDLSTDTAARPAATAPEAAPSFDKNGIRVAEAIAKMNDCVLNTDASGRPDGALMDAWSALVGALSVPSAMGPHLTASATLDHSEVILTFRNDEEARAFYASVNGSSDGGTAK